MNSIRTFQSNKLNQQFGFTLIELLVVVSLIIIVVGVTGDIIVSLVRSYSKTQITTEVEQNANFVLTKMVKELKNAEQLVSVAAEQLTFTQKKSNGILETISYTVEDGSSLPGSAPGTYYLARSVDGGSRIPLTNYTSPAGVTIVRGETSFANISPASGPSVVKIILSLRQIGNPAVQFTQTTKVESTVVIRGSY